MTLVVRFDQEAVVGKMFGVNAGIEQEEASEAVAEQDSGAPPAGPSPRWRESEAAAISSEARSTVTWDSTRGVARSSPNAKALTERMSTTAIAASPVGRPWAWTCFRTYLETIATP
jgi:hypothetical protein